MRNGGSSRRSALWWATVAVVITGCAMETRGGRDGPGWEPDIPIDACPTGGTLMVTLWEVYATPRKPDGSVWDGISSGTIELTCSAAADTVRHRVRNAVDAQLPYAGSIANQIVGDAFEETVAELCGLAGNWLQMNFEGPDLVAYGAYFHDTVWRWMTPEAPNTWAARLNTTTTGAPASWEFACDARDEVAVLRVIDVDLAFDDEVGAVGLDISSIPDETICNGWAYYSGLEGIAGVLVRLDVLDADAICP